jgi:hypothetical protein
MVFVVYVCGTGQTQIPSSATHIHNKVQITIYASTPPSNPGQCISTHFNNCNFSKAQVVFSMRMVFFTQKSVGACNVKFNANLKLFLRISNCASVGEKTLMTVQIVFTHHLVTELQQQTQKWKKRYLHILYYFVKTARFHFLKLVFFYYIRICKN